MFAACLLVVKYTDTTSFFDLISPYEACHTQRVFPFPGDQKRIVTTVTNWVDLCIAIPSPFGSLLVQALIPQVARQCRRAARSCRSCQDTLSESLQTLEFLVRKSPRLLLSNVEINIC